MSTTYEPGYIPEDVNALAQALRREFMALKAGLEAAKVSETFVIHHAEPARLRAGLLVLADGVDWDPGSGAGMYRRNEANSAWVFIG